MPDEKKTTMSVAEMGKMLGLGKTEPYWLVHKNCFETIMVNGKMRVVIESFEKWYANQTKRKKVNGPPPGEELRANSYSVQEIADMLSLDNTSVYYLIRRDQIPTFKAETWTRIRKSDFEKWYASQNKHRTQEDRENDFVIIADKKRITRESFERWYAGQSKYRKLSDRTPEELEEIRMAEKKKEAPRLEVDPDKPSYNVRETAVLMDLTPDEVRRLIREGKLAAKKYGASYIIRRENISWWLEQQKRFAES